VIAYAEVDEADYAELSQHRWGINPDGYARRTSQRPTPSVCPECGWTPDRPFVYVPNSIASHRAKMHGVTKALLNKQVPRRTILMHRVILGLADDDKRQGDHINRNRLDCRRVNLRIVSAGGNMQNQGAIKTFKGKPVESAYRGVNMVKKKGKHTGRWKAMVCGKYLGCFPSEIEAAQAAADYRLKTMPLATD
jgi:hypothetical protein